MPLPRAGVERLYARGLYPLVQPRLTALSNCTPFALFDASWWSRCRSTAVLWTVRLRGARRNGRAGGTFGGLALDTVAIAAVLYLWFLAAWGLNYRREPLRDQLDFHEDRITREALRALAIRNIDSLNALSATRMQPDGRIRCHAGWARPAFERAQRDLAMAWTRGRTSEANAPQFLFHARIDRRDDQPVLPGDTRQSEACFRSSAPRQWRTSGVIWPVMRMNRRRTSSGGSCACAAVRPRNTADGSRCTAR